MEIKEKNINQRFKSIAFDNDISKENQFLTDKNTQHQEKEPPRLLNLLKKIITTLIQQIITLKNKILSLFITKKTTTEKNHPQSPLSKSLYLNKKYKHWQITKSKETQAIRKIKLLIAFQSTNTVIKKNCKLLGKSILTDNNYVELFYLLYKLIKKNKNIYNENKSQSKLRH